MVLQGSDSSEIDGHRGSIVNPGIDVPVNINSNFVIGQRNT